MLLENFADLTLAKGIETEFVEESLTDIEAAINSQTAMELEELPVGKVMHCHERKILLDEFRQEVTLAIVLKFTNDVLCGELQLEEDKVLAIVKQISDELVKDEYSKLFVGYVPYNELIVSNYDTKQFAITDDANMDDTYYGELFENLSEVIYNIIENMGYTLFDTNSTENTLVQ